MRTSTHTYNNYKKITLILNYLTPLYGVSLTNYIVYYTCSGFNAHPAGVAMTFSAV